MAKYKKKLEDDIRCPLEYGLTIFGGKWKSRIICVLAANEKLRYSEIRKEMYNITDAVLAATLKDLIKDEFVDRKSYDEIPPRVEYSLTEKGKSVVPIRVLDETEMLAQIHYVLVHPDYQGQGIAGKMLEYIKEKYKDYVYIEVMPEDKNNVPFYVKNGFSVMENGAAIQICNLGNQ